MALKLTEEQKEEFKKPWKPPQYFVGDLIIDKGNERTGIIVDPFYTSDDMIVRLIDGTKRLVSKLYADTHCKISSAREV